MSAMEFDQKEQAAQTEVLLPIACGFALLTLAPVALRQVHLLRHLPDPPSKFFDSDGITGSKQAYPFGMPDGVLGLSSYAVTSLLALLVLRGDAKSSGLTERLLGIKLLADGTAAAFNTVRQVLTFRKLCSWCMGTVLATGVMVYAGRRFIAQMRPR